MDTLFFCCSACKSTKPASDFHKNKTRKTGYGSECKPCVLARAKARYDADPEKHRQRRRDWYAADPEKGKATTRAYKDRNPEKTKSATKRYKDANREKMQEYWKTWAAQNPERILANNRKKRAAKRNVLSEPYTKQDILDTWGTDCHLCQEPIDFAAPRRSKKGLQLDHVIPISKGGPDVISNVKPAHAYCNQSKKDKLIPQVQSQ